ncbi:MAG: DUF58 domain-containing protein [Dehalococcoidia bacterium]|nr:DUF58 domain-containing protein [Dehalococcoidia bacterium]
MHKIAAVFSRFYARTTSRGRGMMLLLAVTLILAIASGEGVLYSVSYFLTLVIVGSYVYLWPRLRHLDIRIQSKSHVVQVGDMLKVHVYLRNDSRLGTGWVEIMLTSDMPGSVLGIATAVSARGQERLEIHALCHARGVYTIGPLLARTSDPLGLFRVKITRGNPVKVMVQPPVVALPYFRLPLPERLGEESLQYRSPTRTPQVATVREYIHGDTLNQIHWLSTAKNGQLMSKEFDSGWGGDVWVVLDLERRIHRSQGTDRTDECAAAIAASLTHLILREEHSMGLIAYGDREYLLPLGGGAKQMSRVLETITLSKTEGDSPLAKVLMRNSGQFGTSVSLLVVTSSTATEWISILRELRCRSLNIAVVFVDPASFGGERSPDQAVMELVGAGIPAYVVHKGDALPYALSRPITPDDLLIFKQHGKPEQTRTCQVSWNRDTSPEATTTRRASC